MKFVFPVYKNQKYTQPSLCRRNFEIECWRSISPFVFPTAAGAPSQTFESGPQILSALSGSVVFPGGLRQNNDEN